MLLMKPAIAAAEIARFSPFDTQRQVDASFTHLAHVAPDAPQGGTLRTGSTVNFDSTNPMRFPGRSPNALRYTFDTLLVPSDSEPGAFYGLLAKEIEVSEDFTSARFVLNDKAYWHDGSAITARDVAFTFETVRAHGLPFDRSLLGDIVIETEGVDTIIFQYSGEGSWQWISELGQFPIQSSAYWQELDPSEATLTPPMGSGPYQMTRIAFNEQVIIQRVPDYWAANHPLNRGRWNFDEIVVDYFFDNTAMIEALKKGDLDVLREWNATSWRERYAGPALDAGRLVRTAVRRQDGGSLTTLVFNLRRSLLEDVRVREAIALALDTQWYEELHGSVFELPGSFYGDSRLAAKGAAAAAEQALLAPYMADLPNEILDHGGPDEIHTGLTERQRLQRANNLLDAAGFPFEGRYRIDPDTGEQLRLTYVTAHPTTARQLAPLQDMLERVGVTLELSVHDYVSGRRLILDHAYDLTWLKLSANDPPGTTEQRFWHSSQSGDQGYGLAGLSHPASDMLIEIMLGSRNEEEIVTAARAFDRFLRWGHYTIPLWHEVEDWYVHASGLGFPDPGRVRMDPAERWFWIR
ncbi:extracellular solute-binding protein [Cognatiyoonia sp. IB215182]|nr:extracellular solute-binding protein [Cognatiyoonia sp. IB215182]